jgi:hypothetical protein
MLERYNLDVDSPEKVLTVLETVANFYRASAEELQADWQDKSAGAIWGDFATILDRAAQSCRKALDKRGLS